MVLWYQSVYLLPYEAPYETYTDNADVDESGASSFEPNLSTSLLKRQTHRDSGDFSYWDRDRATSPSEVSSSDSSGEELDDGAGAAPPSSRGLSISIPMRLTVTQPRQAPTSRTHTWQPLAQPAERRPPAEWSEPQRAARGPVAVPVKDPDSVILPSIDRPVVMTSAAAPSAEQQHTARLALLRPNSARRQGSARRAGVVAMQVRAFEVMRIDDPPTLRSMPPPPRPRSAAPATLGAAGGAADGAHASRPDERLDAAQPVRPRTASEAKRADYSLGAPPLGLSPGSQPQPGGAALWARGSDPGHSGAHQPATQQQQQQQQQQQPASLFRISSPAIRPAARPLRRRSPMLGGGSGNSLELQQWQLQGHQQQRQQQQGHQQQRQQQQGHQQQQRRSPQQPSPARPATAGAQLAATGARAVTPGARAATPDALRSHSGGHAAAAAAASSAGRQRGGHGHALPALFPAAGHVRPALAPSMRRGAAASHARGSSTVAYAKTTLRIFEPHVVTGSFLTTRPGRPHTPGQGAQAAPRERPASARPKSRSAASQRPPQSRVNILRFH